MGLKIRLSSATFLGGNVEFECITQISSVKRQSVHSSNLELQICQKCLVSWKFIALYFSIG